MWGPNGFDFVTWISALPWRRSFEHGIRESGNRATASVTVRLRLLYATRSRTSRKTRPRTDSGAALPSWVGSRGRGAWWQCSTTIRRRQRLCRCYIRSCASCRRACASSLSGWVRYSLPAP